MTDHFDLSLGIEDEETEEQVLERFKRAMAERGLSVELLNERTWPECPKVRVSGDTTAVTDYSREFFNEDGTPRMVDECPK